MVNPPNDGRRQGWWGLLEPVEAFLDQIITWRDIGFIHCAMVENHTEYESLPSGQKPHLLNTLMTSDRTSTRLRSLRWLQLTTRSGTQHKTNSQGGHHPDTSACCGGRNSNGHRTPETAMEWMIILNDKWALDGRIPIPHRHRMGDGQFDRGWTERAVYGKIRTTSASTARKFKTKGYVEKYNAERTLHGSRLRSIVLLSPPVRIFHARLPTLPLTMLRWRMFGRGTTALGPSVESCPSGKASVRYKQAPW